MPNKKINALDVRVATATDLMLVGDPTTGTAFKSTLATLPLVPTSRTLTINGVAFDLSANRAWTISSVTSVGLTMPSAFSVANSPITSSGTLAVTANGTASQYIRGDGQLATLPSNGSGGSSVAYYLNGSVAASVATYYQMSKTPVIGTGTDFSKAGNGLISQFLTDVADPNRLQIPAGNWNFEMYFSASSSGGNPAFYVELLKYNGTTFTSIASSSANPEGITNGTTIDLYVTALAIPQTTLLATDRLAIRVYIVNSTGGRTITMHTENSHLCEIITNFPGGVSALNGLTANTQYFATGTSGTDFAISSATDTHTFNLPTASATNRGALSSADWTSFNGRVPSTRTLTINGTTQDLSADRSWTIAAGITGSGVANQLTYWNGTGSVTGNAELTYVDTTGVITLSKNQNEVTKISISNTTSNTNSAAQLTFTSDALSGGGSFGKFSTGTTPIKTLSSKDFFLYNAVGGDISILNDFATGKIKFASGAASTAQMTLTAAGRLLLGTTTEGTYILDAVGTARVSGDMSVNGLTIGKGGGNVSTNTALGSSSLLSNTSGFDNSAFGFESLRNLTTGLFNSAFGLQTLRLSIVGTHNSAFGYSTLYSSVGLRNSSFGSQSFYSLSSGNDNTSLGFNSGRYISGGATANTTSNNSIFIGSDTKALADNQTNQIVIGYNATGNGSNTTTIGNSSTISSQLYGVLLETITTNRQTASYSLVLADRGKLVEMNVASANTLTIPLNSSIAFPIGTKIDVTQYGAGATTITATGGVTIRSFTSFLKIAGQYAACTLVKIGTDEWYCYGNLIA